jgi:hypothetical protein
VPHLPTGWNWYYIAGQHYATWNDGSVNSTQGGRTNTRSRAAMPSRGRSISTSTSSSTAEVRLLPKTPLARSVEFWVGGLETGASTLHQIVASGTESPATNPNFNFIIYSAYLGR